MLTFGFLVPRPEGLGYTLKCFSIGTLKTIDIPYIPNGKLVFLGVPLIKHIIIGL